MRGGFLLKKSMIAMLAAASLGVGAETVATCGTWAAEDALGRKVTICESGVKPNKEAIIFYWTWHNEEEGPGSRVKNITEIIRTVPGAMTTGNQPCWNNGVSGGRFFWDEPLFGYYKTWDKWVLRKHAEMLAAAQIDAVFFDCTNGSFTWDKSTDALLETWDTARRQGVKVPRIGFMLPFGPAPHSLVSLRHLYKRLYKPGKYRELWYCRAGKPCIMAYPDNLTQSAEDQEIKAFFTFRPGQPDYVNGPHRIDQWGWLENYPQHGYGRTADGRPELVTAGVAQNACPETKGHCSAFNVPGSFGRSFTKRQGFDKRPEAHLWGANFAEQWDRVYELNPDAVFITGWNEWTAGIWYPRDRWSGKPFSFVDQFDWDHSRDCEPCKAWGDKGDVYYLMLVDRIRRFKGGALAPKVSAPKTIRSAADWQDVAPLYPASKGNVFHRHSRGYGEKVYDDVSGRNDIVGAKVARDGQWVWFAVWTDKPLTPSTNPAWMTLFIDADRSKTTGWNGYDLIVNRVSPRGRGGLAASSKVESTESGLATVERAKGSSWSWTRAVTAEYQVHGNLLMLRLPRNLFGAKLNFEFKWGDNLKLQGDVMDFYVSGDTAPLGRFNFVYKED